MHAQLAAGVAQNLGDVVSDVIDLARAFDLGAEHARDRLPDAVGQDVAVGPGEVRRGSHRPQVRLALSGRQRRTRQLAVRELDVEAAQLRRSGSRDGHPAGCRVDEGQALPAVASELVLSGLARWE